jgi:hypothetical protein
MVGNALRQNKIFKYEENKIFMYDIEHGIYKNMTTTTITCGLTLKFPIFHCYHKVILFHPYPKNKKIF